MQGSLAESLRLLRARKGLSLLAASEQLGVDRHTLRDLELGQGRTPRYPTLAKIAEGYGVPVEDLLEEPVPLVDAPEAGLTGQAEAAKLHGPSLQGWLIAIRSLYKRWAPQIAYHEGAMAQKVPTIVRVENRGRAMTWGVEIHQTYNDLVDGILYDPLFPGAYRPEDVLQLYHAFKTMQGLLDRTERWYEGTTDAEVVDLQARRAHDERLQEKLAPLIEPHQAANAKLRSKGA
jgi:transcriptional regulator with XRE-family HTH domain